MRIHRHPPGGSSALVRDWLAGRELASSFYPGHPADLESYRLRMEFVEGAFSPTARERVARSLGGGGPDREARLAAFVDRRGFVVTTGQQPVLFGGPLYVLYKAVTARALAQRLEEAFGVPVLPVFWIAGEDHDWDEARSVDVLDVDNELRSVGLPKRKGDRPALHRIVPGQALLDAVTALLDLLPDTDFSARWRDVLRGACDERATLPEAMATVMDGVLGPWGVFYLQSHAPEVKEHTMGILLRELELAAENESRLRSSGERLQEAGYDLQVPILDRAVNLFMEGSRGRERLLRDGDRFHLRRSGEPCSLEEIRDRAAGEPRTLSPNVLLRPVVEAAFLPTLAYVAGPGESAYLAQTGALFEAHGVERPVVVPRLSASLIESKVDKVLEKYGLDPEALVRPHHELAGELVREEVPPAIHKALGEFRGAVGRHASALSEALRELDPTLKGPVDHVRSQAFAALDDVERKVVQALKRENEIALAQLEKSQVHLFPGGRPQERVLTFWYYLFRYGSGLVDRLVAEASAGLPGSAPDA